MSNNINGLVPIQAAVLIPVIEKLLFEREISIAKRREAAVIEAMKPVTTTSWFFFKKTTSRTREEAVAHLQKRSDEYWGGSPWESIGARGIRTADMLEEVLEAARLARPVDDVFVNSYIAYRMQVGMKEGI